MGAIWPNYLQYKPNICCRRYETIAHKVFPSAVVIAQAQRLVNGDNT